MNTPCATLKYPFDLSIHIFLQTTSCAVNSVWIVTDINSKTKLHVVVTVQLPNFRQQLWILLGPSGGTKTDDPCQRRCEAMKLALESALFNIYGRWKYTYTCIYMYSNVWVSIWMKMFKNGPKKPHSIQHICIRHIV